MQLDVRSTSLQLIIYLLISIFIIFQEIFIRLFLHTCFYMYLKLRMGLGFVGVFLWLVCWGLGDSIVTVVCKMFNTILNPDACVNGTYKELSNFTCKTCPQPRFVPPPRPNQLQLVSLLRFGAYFLVTYNKSIGYPFWFWLVSDVFSMPAGKISSHCPLLPDNFKIAHNLSNILIHDIVCYRHLGFWVGGDVVI